VFIVYDSDVTTNPDVAAAIVKLIAVLTARGAIPRVATVPELGPGKKAGLDDYIVARGFEEFSKVVMGSAKEGALGKALWEFNERFAVIAHPTMILDEQAQDHAGRAMPTLMRVTDFNTLTENRRIVETVTNAKGETKLVEVIVSNEWRSWPARREYSAVTYAPGQPRVVDGRLNGWVGLAVEPVKGCIAPWVELLDHLFTNASHEARVWLERWCGYPLKFLGTKLMSAVGMWSTFQGVGKTLLGETLGAIYGRNYISVPHVAMDADHNGWMANRQFVLVDDIPSFESRKRADLLKKLITQAEVLIDEKFVPHYSVPDFMNYYFTSNQANAFFLEPNDRRMFIHEVRIAKLPSEFYGTYHRWLEGSGPAALLYYFQEQLDYGDFDPKHSPPLTDAKKQMTTDSAAEVDAWLSDLATLDLGGRELWSAAELCEKFNSGAVSRKLAPNAFGVALRLKYPNLGAMRVGKGVMRLYAIQNTEYWEALMRNQSNQLPTLAAKHFQDSKKF
jgi:hypothetical protein